MKLTIKDREFEVFLIEYVEMAEKWTTDEEGNAISMLSQEITEVVETGYSIYENGEYITTLPSPDSLSPPATLASYLTSQLEKHLASSDLDYIECPEQTTAQTATQTTLKGRKEN